MTTTHMPPAPIPDSELEPWDPQHPTTAAASDLDGWSAPVEKAASEQSQPASSCTPTSSKPGTTPRCRPRPHLLLQLTAAAPPSCFFSSLLLPPHLLLIAACRFSTSFTDRKAEAYHKCTKFGQVAALSQHHPSEIHCFSYAAARRCLPTARPLREAYPGQASRSSGQRSNPGPVPVSELGGQAGSQVAWCRQVPNQTVSASCLTIADTDSGTQVGSDARFPLSEKADLQRPVPRDLWHHGGSTCGPGEVWRHQTARLLYQPWTRFISSIYIIYI